MTSYTLNQEERKKSNFLKNFKQPSLEQPPDRLKDLSYYKNVTKTSVPGVLRDRRWGFLSIVERSIL